MDASTRAARLPGAEQSSLGDLVRLPQPTTLLEYYLYILNLHADQTHVLYKLMEGHLAYLRDLFTDQVPKGFVAGLNDTLAAQTTQTLEWRPPLFTMLLTNSGPAALQYQVPGDSSAMWITLAAGTSDYFAFNEPKIKTFSIRTPGAATAWRAVGIY